MRRSLVFFIAALMGMFFVGLAPSGAMAGPLPAVSDLNVKSGALEKAQYSRRYYRRLRRQGYVAGTVPVVPPGAVVVAPGPVIVPLRPSSCGQYHYWNGYACVDARYNDPDLGPRP